MKVLAVDPGTTESAYVVYESDTRDLIKFGKIENSELMDLFIHDFDCLSADHCAIEMLKSYGNVMGDSVLKTCVWIGRFIEAWHRDDELTLLPRKTIVTSLCHSPRAKDKNVRQALIDLFADHPDAKPGKTPAIGTSKDKGPLYGVSKDVWAALSVAIAYIDIYHLAKDDDFLQ